MHVERCTQCRSVFQQFQFHAQEDVSMAGHARRHTVHVQKVTMATIVKYVSFRDLFVRFFSESNSCPSL